MKAAIMYDINNVHIEEVPKPSISDNDILIKIDSCSICGSDLRIIANGSSRIKFPQILGHEIAGKIVEIGKKVNKKFKIGDKVALSADIPCGLCEWCKNGVGNHCSNTIAFGYETQGGFAEYLKIDERIINYGPLCIIDDTENRQDEYSLSEPLACCINGYELCNIKLGHKVLIIGAGPMGCMLSELGYIMGASTVILTDIDPIRINIAKKSIHADEYVLSTNENLMEIYKKYTNGQGFDIIIVACPSVDAQEISLKLIKRKGIINFFAGLPGTDRDISFKSNIIHYNEIFITGSHGSTPLQHKKAVELIKKRKINLSNIISKKFKLDDFNEAIKELREDKSNLKIVINP
ncbi:MAG: alcohol dehydrogenase catalytic domain-containing protein [Candidatus Woesearchaeota archaeon]